MYEVFIVIVVVIMSPTNQIFTFNHLYILIKDYNYALVIVKVLCLICIIMQHRKHSLWGLVIDYNPTFAHMS